MNGSKKIALALVLGVGGLSLAARELLSFQMDAAGAKGMARAWIDSAGGEMGISTEVRSKVTGLAEFGIDQASPVLAGIYQNLSAIEQGAAGKAAEVRLEDMHKQLLSLVDVKDRVVAEAGKNLSPRERATTIVKVVARLKEQFHPTPEGTEAIVSSLRSARQSALKDYLKLDAARAKLLFAAMDRYAAQRKAVRGERRELFRQLETAVSGNATDAALGKVLSQWDQLTARMSDITRQQIAEASKLFTTAEKIELVVRAKRRIDRAMKIVALIGKFAPVTM